MQIMNQNLRPPGSYILMPTCHIRTWFSPDLLFGSEGQATIFLLLCSVKDIARWVFLGWNPGHCLDHHVKKTRCNREGVMKVLVPSGISWNPTVTLWFYMAISISNKLRRVIFLFRKTQVAQWQMKSRIFLVVMIRALTQKSRIWKLKKLGLTPDIPRYFFWFPMGNFILVFLFGWGRMAEKSENQQIPGSVCYFAGEGWWALWAERVVRWGWFHSELSTCTEEAAHGREWQETDEGKTVGSGPAVQRK